MKKVFLILLITIFSWPFDVCAKTAIITKIQAGLTKAQSTIEPVIKEAEKKSEEIQTAVSSRENMEKAARDQINSVKSQINEAKSKEVSNVAASGIAASVSGSEPTADMQDKVAEAYVNREEKNDVEAQKAFENRINEENIMNVSAMYARGLVKRYKLQQEGAELLEEQQQSSSDNVSDVTAEVKKVKMRAAARWIGIMQEMANMQENMAKIQLSNMQAPTKPDEDDAN